MLGRGLSEVLTKRLRFGYEGPTAGSRTAGARMLHDAASQDARTGQRIGDWCADAATNQLVGPTGTVRIEPKAMEVLLVLAAHAGQVVSRERLLATVWAGTVVGDEALTQSVIKLRRALGDDARRPAYIETIAKRGYRLIAPVGDIQHAPAVSGPATASAPPPPRHRRQAAWVAIGALAAVALAALAWTASRLPSPSTARVDDTTLADADEAALAVAVLPFETLDAGPEQAYLARGVGHDLMTDLGRSSGLRVMGSAGDAARAPDSARYVVSGSVQRAAAQLRVHVRLTDARTQQQLWSQRYERPFGDLLAMQDEIGRSLLEHLPAKIDEAEQRRRARPYTRSAEAYELFLRGQALFLARSRDDNQRARALYTSALDLDPGFARAYAGLAMTHAMDVHHVAPAEAEGALARALELAETARSIDPDLPDVHWALGFVLTQSRRHDDALASLRRAVELNPSYADAYALVGGIQTYVGRPAQSIPMLRKALRLNPAGGSLYYLLLGRSYFYGGDIEQASINLREALARNPDNLEARVYLAAALMHAGNARAAQWEADEVRVRQPAFSLQRWLQTYPMTSAPHRERLASLATAAGL
jgi:DNA-binding winged helix-turn-helix (wHTH) protein/TolB-like protein